MIAIVALVLAIGGGSFAVANIGAQAVKQIATRVADQRITARASHLSVKHAATAGDATRLGGRSPSTYLDRVGMRTFGRDAVTVPGGADVDVTAGKLLKISAPPGIGFVEVDGSATDYGAASPSNWVLWIQADGPCAESGSAFDSRSYGRLAGADDQETLSQHFVFAVGPGIHTYRLCVSSAQSSAVTSQTLVARVVARGTTGAAPRGARRSPDGTARPAGPITRP